MSTRHQLLQIIAMATVGLLLLMTSVIDTVDARGPPKIIESNYQMRHLVREGEHVFRLVCPVDSSPPPLIAWIKDEDTIHLGWERYKISGEKLVIKDLEVTDSGVFICRATNGFGTVDVRYLVYVYADSNNTVVPSADFDEAIFDTIPGNEAPPSFLAVEEMKSPLSPNIGSSLELSCKLTGRPVPAVSWFKNGARIGSEKLNRVTINDDIRGVSILHLPEVLEIDAGRYTCIAQNKVGAVNYTFTVNVDDSAGHKAGFIAHYPKNVTVAYGETAELHCFVHSTNTPPRIQWLRQVEPTMDMRNNTSGVVTIANRPYMVLESDQTIARQDGTYFNKLVIHGTTEQDAGVYVCTKTDNQGFHYRSAHLSVLAGTRGLLDDDNLSPLSLDSPFLPIILAIVLVGCAILVAIVVFVLYRRRANNHENTEAQHATLPRPAASSSSVAGSTVGYPGRSPDKRLDHHYAALQMSSGSGTPKSVAHDRLGRDIVFARGVRDNNFSDQSSMMSDAAAASPFHQQYSQQQQQHQHQQQQSLLYQRQNHHLLQQQQQYYPQNKQLLHNHNLNQANNSSRPGDIAYC